MMKTTFSIVFLIISLNVLSQKETNNWYFGGKAGINFNVNPPVAVFNGSLFSGEGCASISDTNGGLLFYSRGDTIWNKLHQVMANGTGLFGDPSTTQSAIITKQPGSDSLYYIFTLDA